MQKKFWKILLVAKMSLSLSRNKLNQKSFIIFSYKHAVRTIKGLLTIIWGQDGCPMKKEMKSCSTLEHFWTRKELGNYYWWLLRWLRKILGWDFSFVGLEPIESIWISCYMPFYKETWKKLRKLQKLGISSQNTRSNNFSSRRISRLSKG